MLLVLTGSLGCFFTYRFNLFLPSSPFVCICLQIPSLYKDTIPVG